MRDAQAASHWVAAQLAAWPAGQCDQQHHPAEQEADVLRRHRTVPQQNSPAPRTCMVVERRLELFRVRRTRPNRMDLRKPSAMMKRYAADRLTARADQAPSDPWRSTASTRPLMAS